jgi:hypothetical protein
MINNLELIKPLLTFEDEHDFYMLYIFKRKKDQPEGEKDNHQSVRTIRSYCISSIEQLEKKYEEIILLCETFKARAYIHVAKQNHKDVSLEMLVELATRIKSGAHKQQNLFDSVVGQIKTYEKRWIVDVDTKDEKELQYIIGAMCDCEPLVNEATERVLEMIPTKNGYHLITTRFDVRKFKQHCPNIDIQKKNPTLLYYPNSLDAL